MLDSILVGSMIVLLSLLSILFGFYLFVLGGVIILFDFSYRNRVVLVGIIIIIYLIIFLILLELLGWKIV